MTKLKSGLAIGAVMALLVGPALGAGNWTNLPLAGGGPAWAVSTAYTQGAFAQANGNTYQETVLSCTSNSTGAGPSGTRSSPVIGDGTCGWAYIGPAYATAPLTGNELFPADTGLNQGQSPASERISPTQIAAFAATAFQSATLTNTTAFTLTAAQVTNTACQGEKIILLTGTLGSGQAVTIPTAALTNAVCPTPDSWLVKVVNQSSGNFAWTVTAGTGGTVTGPAAVAQNTSQTYLVTMTSATAVTWQNVGN